ncbi:erythrocyte membrane protein 1, PfEMP1 [Plasmodium sp. DRC-Itaito]|nr:erythrocyte membrane protein 1, PfEMP1 [Plasmodium sp. DRC-Itaito]
MGPVGGGGEGVGWQDKDASVKHLFDRIGKNVHQPIKDEGKNFSDDLKGILTKAKIFGGETADSLNPCFLIEEYIGKEGDSGEPCGTGKEDIKRFSDTHGGQCTKEKISGSTKKEGACAPYRRLHLCNHNLERISAKEIKNKNDLLAEVCMAAYYEGQSITTNYPQHQSNNPDNKMQLCTVLARSFADIGDIIRGKDLFHGNPQEQKQRDNLNSNLKTIFGNIYEELKENNNNRQAEIETRYRDNENYFQLREDWWDANRQEVWKAITCHAESYNYFQATCKGGKLTAGHCRCKEGNIVPTYFDYVPQFLRWFEEWAEDFCQKKKKKLKAAKEQCRGENGSEKYCSGNGYDCTKTVYKKGKLVIGSECTKCSILCRLYEKWIDNQKKEFIKQREKYKKGILFNGSQIQSTNGKHKEYEKKFYNQLKKEKMEVNKFLKLLSEEAVCTEIKEKEEIVDFTKVDEGHDRNKNDEGTFYHAQYCKPCHECGMKWRDGEWKQRGNGQCKADKHYKIIDENRGKEIKVLSFGDKRHEIKNKIQKFCIKEDSQEQWEKWKCYKHDNVETLRTNDSDDEDEEEDADYIKHAGGLCTLKNEKEEKTKEDPDEFQKTFNDFFYYWIGRFLNDSMYWRNKVGSCLKNNKITCRSEKCKDDCICFIKWITQKQEEWKQIKDQFETQDDIFQETNTNPMDTLEFILEFDELLKNIKEGYGDAKEIQGIEEMVKKEKELEEEEKKTGAVADNIQKTPIDKLLKHELDEANKCKENQEKCDQAAGGGLGRTAEAHTPPAVEKDHHSDNEDEDEIEEEEEAVTDTAENKDAAEPSAAELPPPPSPNVCLIVADIMKKDTLKAACPTKYGEKTRYLGWRCVQSGSNTTQSGGDEASVAEGAKARPPRSVGSPTEAPSGQTGGSICVPPRRRKLYVGKIEEWANNPSGNTVSGTEGAEAPADGQETPTTTDPQKKLLEAFIHSAAVETFFLWDRYNKIKTKEIEERKKTEQPTFSLKIMGTDESLLDDNDRDKTPDEQLKKGTIPNDFLRQMFYTLGDYKDIFFGVSDSDVREALKRSFITARSDSTETKSDKEQDILDKIKEKIDKILEKPSGTEHPGPPLTASSVALTSDEKRKSWWDSSLGKYIWEGMICALTYKENGDKAPTRDETVYQKLWDAKENKPNKNAGKNNDQDYTYEKVELKEENDTGPKNRDASQHDEATKLTEFIERPPYFRYLEEWGESFCKERKRRLEKIKEECTQKDDGAKKNCSGYGEHCDDQLSDDPTNFRDLWCPDCGKFCRLYKRWIERKGKEFKEQEKSYDKQKRYASSNADAKRDNEFYNKLQTTYTDTSVFLHNLGACSINNDNSEKGNGGDILNFKYPDKTFVPAKNCKPCSAFKIDCKDNIKCILSKTQDCNGNKITAQTIENMKEHMKDVDMRVNDKNSTDFPSDLNGVCKDAHIYTGIKKEAWKCGKVCGYNVCTLENAKGETFHGQAHGEKPFITITGFVKYWLDYFFEDYIKINKKLNPCMNSKVGNPCKYNCENKCNCAKTWIGKKKDEWGKIKERLNEQYNGGNTELNPSVRSSLEDSINGTAAIIDKGKHKSSVSLVKSFKCNCIARSENSDGKDPVLCLLENLQKEIETCEDKPRGETEQDCEKFLPPSDEPDDEPLEEEQQTDVTNIMPQICKGVVETKTQQEKDTDDTCDQPESPPAELQKNDDLAPPDPPADIPPPSPPGLDNPEQTPVLKPEEEAPAPEENPLVAPIEKKAPQSPSATTPEKAKSKKEQRQTPTPRVDVEPQPKLSDVLLPSAFPLTVGMGFLALSYWLLKKKTKSPVDLFRVMEIPQKDYGMPTKLSSNRYIPYSSGKYRGKRYIYIEGDSNSGHYYEDTTDITSSESEYEEIDTYISRIPKYKTLIEVVLEPSKRETNSGDHIPSDNTPTNKPINDEEWNKLKDEFISNMLQKEQNTEPTPSDNNVDNNTHPTPSHVSMDEKPFIISIHDRNLYTGEEYIYDMSTNSGNNDSLSGNLGSYGDRNDPLSDENDSLRDNNVSYSGIDLVNDALSSNRIDIYDEMLKRKENELFGTQHHPKKNTYSVAKHTYSDPIECQLNLFHKWLDRHRDMCEKWGNKVEMLDKLKELWDKDNNSGIIHPSDNKMLNTDVSIQIHMDTNPVENQNPVDSNPENSSMDSILDDMEKYNEPYYDIYKDDIIHFDIDDEKTPMDLNNVDNNKSNVSSKVQIEMDVNNHKLVKGKYPISDIWNI